MYIYTQNTHTDADKGTQRDRASERSTDKELDFILYKYIYVLRYYFIKQSSQPHQFMLELHFEEKNKQKNRNF